MVLHDDYDALYHNEIIKYHVRALCQHVENRGRKRTKDRRRIGIKRNQEILQCTRANVRERARVCVCVCILTRHEPLALFSCTVMIFHMHITMPMMSIYLDDCNE